MAMIEVSDLAAPLRKWTNILSMVLAVLLFVAFRLSGGGINLSLSHDSPARDSVSSETTRSAASFLEEDDRVVSQSSKRTHSSSSGFVERDDDFDPLAAPSTGQRQEEEVVDAFGGSPNENSESGGFAEIEKELGL